MKTVTRVRQHPADHITRRDVLRFFPALAGLPMVRTWLKRHPLHRWPDCVVVPQQTEGPYFADVKLNRSDIRTDPKDGSVCAGVPLRLRLDVSHVSGTECAPLSGAMVDIWQCDTHGRYSAFRDSRADLDLRGQQFLRGYQITDSGGTARFVTIVPGWYRGRTIHTHFKIRTDPDQNSGYEFTSQLYFDEAVATELEGREDYAANPVRRVTNARDSIYRRGGDRLTLAVEKDEDGLTAAFAVGLDF